MEIDEEDTMDMMDGGQYGREYMDGNIDGNIEENTDGDI